VNARNGALMSNAAGTHMWMSSGFSAPAGGTFDHVTIGAAGSLPRFIDVASGNYDLADSFPGIVDAGLDIASIYVPQQVGNRLLVAFQVPLGSFARIFIGAPDIGAYEWRSGQDCIRARAPSVVRVDNNVTGAAAVDLMGRVVPAVLRDRKGAVAAPGLYLTRTRSADRCETVQRKIVR